MSKFTLHERTPNVSRCAFLFGQSAVKRIMRVVGTNEVELNFSNGARSALFKELGTVSCIERSIGDSYGKVNYGGNVSDSGKKEERNFCQKEDISFEFDSRMKRWYAIFVFDAAKDLTR